ncbi:MAG: glycoside hydrolase family 2 TIM barrel-domain containing protein [Bacteroidota bacterium]
MKKYAAIALFLVFTLTLNAQQISTHHQRLTDKWEHIRQDVGGIWEVLRPARQGRPEYVPIWEKVTMPHCFNAEDAVDPDKHYYQGPGWYRTALKIQNPYKNGRTILHFEGAGQKTSVWVGTEKAGEHVGGYDEWSVDITEYLESARNNPHLTEIFEDKVPISIRCDNSRDLEMIPSDLSDFNIYGGLYRYVNLIYLPEAYISQLHVTPELSAKRNGTAEIDINLHNPDQKPVDVKATVFEPEGKVVYEYEKSTTDNTLKFDVPVKRVKRWSTDNPALYQIKVSATSASGEQVYTDQFGFRDFHFEEHGPFYLNGERLLLKGTHRHEDHAGVAAAMTEDMIRKEMLLIKEMGANFIRLGHYQQSRIVLNLCDSLGILVWEEIPWCRGGLGGKIYKEQARNMLTNMINQHYNHPSVIIWGLGNENDWPGDFTEFDKKAIQEFMAELNDLSHALDPSRKTGIRRCDFCKHIVDVYSPSIWAGWYRGKYTEYKEVSHENMMEVDHFFHMEWGGSSHAGRHDEDPDKGLQNIVTGQGADERLGDASLVGGQARVSRDGNWSETYICNLFDWHLKEQETMPWLTGAAQWAFKDFSTPIRPNNPIPYMNQKGLVQRDWTKKEAFYVFQSYWTEEPMVHIFGHSWPIRWGEPGEEKLIKVYSNCEEAELFVNGKSQGIKKRNSQNYPAAGLRWNLPLDEGTYELKAVGYKNGITVEDTISFAYQTKDWTEPVKLVIKDVTQKDNIARIVVEARDETSTLCLDANEFVRFSFVGDGELIDNLGIVDGSKKVQLTNGTACIEVKIGENGGYFWVSSENMTPASKQIRLK